LPISDAEGVYDLFVRISNGAGKSHIIFNQGKTVIGTADVVLKTSNQWARVGSVELAGTSFDFSMTASAAVNISQFKLVKRSDLTKAEESGILMFKFGTTRNEENTKNILDPQDGANDAIIADYFGQYDDLNSNGWAQFELPEGYDAGDYIVTMNLGATDVSSTIGVYLDSETVDTSVLTEDKAHYINAPENKLSEKTLSFTKPSSGYSTKTIQTVGVVSLDGNKRYFSVKVEDGAHIRFDNITLVKTDLHKNSLMYKPHPVNDWYLTEYEANYTNTIAMNRKGESRLETGDWVAYKVTVAETGTYEFSVDTYMNKESTLELFIGTAGGTSQGQIIAGAGDATDANDTDRSTWYVTLTQGENILRLTNTGVARRIVSVMISPEIVTSITDSQNAEVKVLGTRTNDSFTIKAPSGKTDIFMVAAIYKNGTLINADIAEIVDNQLVAELENINIAENDNAYLKVFYWKNDDSLMPVCPCLLVD